jgi:hypothetical protein
MNSTVVPMPHPRLMGGNTAAYESAPMQKGGKNRRTHRRTHRRFRPLKRRKTVGKKNRR